MHKTRVKAKVLKNFATNGTPRGVVANVQIRDTVYLGDGSIAPANRVES